MPAYDKSINVALMSMTRLRDQVLDLEEAQLGKGSSAIAHTALGGGRLALFGSAALHTWADSIASLVPAFSDCSKIDKTKLLDDSCGRGTYWANFSTGLGATLHELGHCFGLAHVHSGIMARGFDHMNRAFMLQEPVLKARGGKRPEICMSLAASNDPSFLAGAWWNRSSALWLRYSPYFTVAHARGKCKEDRTGLLPPLPIVGHHKQRRVVPEGEDDTTHWVEDGNKSTFKKRSEFQWAEVANGRTYATFSHLVQDGPSVLICDESRNMYVKLANTGCWLSYEILDLASPKWGLLKRGSWRKQQRAARGVLRFIGAGGSGGGVAQMLECAGLPEEMKTLHVSHDVDDVKGGAGDADKVPATYIRWEIGRSNASGLERLLPPQARPFFQYSSGGHWVECSKDGKQVFSFKESARDISAGTVDIFDGGRNIKLRLTPSSCLIVNEDGSSGTLYHGAWHDAGYASQFRNLPVMVSDDGTLRIRLEEGIGAVLFQSGGITFYHIEVPRDTRALSVKVSEVLEIRCGQLGEGNPMTGASVCVCSVAGEVYRCVI